MAEKKQCPYCEKVLGKAGWKMHYAHAHVERDYVPFDKVGASDSGEKVESFREPRKPKSSKPKEEYKTEYRPNEREEESEEGGWGLPGTLLDDD